MTSNSELGLDTDPLTRIVQKRRRDCETLDKSVVASLIEVPWTEYTADPSNHIMSSIIDPRDRLQLILTVYLDQAGKVRESTSNRRKAWNVVQGLLRKIDELLKAQRQTAEAQPPLQTQASAVYQTSGGPRDTTAATSKSIDAPTAAISLTGVSHESSGNRLAAQEASSIIGKIWGFEDTRKTTPSASGETNGANRGIATTSNGISEQTTRKAAPSQATANNGKGNGVSNGAITHSLGQRDRQAAGDRHRPPARAENHQATSSSPGRTNAYDSSQMPLAAARSDAHSYSIQDQSRVYGHAVRPQQPARNAQAAVHNGAGKRSLTNGSSNEGMVNHNHATPAGRAARRNDLPSEQPRDFNHPERNNSSRNQRDAASEAPSHHRQPTNESDRANSQSSRFNRRPSPPGRAQSDAGTLRSELRPPSPSRSQSASANPVWNPRLQFSPAPNGGNESTSRWGAPHNRGNSEESNRPTHAHANRPTASQTSPRPEPSRSGGGAQRNQHRTDTASVEDPLNATRNAQAQRLENRGNPDESNRPSHAHANRPTAVLPTPPRPEQIDRGKPMDVTLLADNSPTFSSSIKERDYLRITFAPQALVRQSLTDLRARLIDGDPFWGVESVIDAGMTSLVAKSPDAARTAARIDINLSKHTIASSQIPSTTWGKPQTDSRKDGDVALILTMLPLSWTLTSNGGKMKRADSHLWPKGTFLQIDGNAIRLTQRRQQGHDLTQWKGMCKHLDVTEHISNPNKITRIQLCCYDDQPYLFCLAFCKFRSADTVYRMLMSPEQNWIEKLSREEGFRKAIQYVNANGQMVVVDSDNDESKPEEAAKLIFSLICPISKMLMQTPVRGKNCKHWQVRIITRCE
jgi:hypothetical protein